MLRLRIEHGKLFGEMTGNDMKQFYMKIIYLFIVSMETINQKVSLSSFLFFSFTPFFKKAIIEAREKEKEDTIFIFCGDGISDISAARHADILFARKGRDLETYCKRENIPFISFDTFAEIEQVVRDLVCGKYKIDKSNNIY